MNESMNDGGNDEFQLRWANLSASYTSNNVLSSERTNSTVLHPCCGEVASGSITAVLGPSGAGKSTLFNCITGKLTSGLTVTGQCFISAARPLVSQLKKSRIAYVPQAAEFFTLFTVRETLLFASRLNNVGWTNKQHDAGMRSLMVSFDMEDKLDWQIRKLSGGQQKRLAIACELVSSPAAIVLDEPTSGLDADNAEKLIRHLKSLVTCEETSMKPAVLLSIHSPSYDVFHCFDQVYIMATGGLNIFQGAPASAVQFFQSHGYQNPRGNPAEWCVEVASGKYGTEKFATMVTRSTVELISQTAEICNISTTSINKPQSSTATQIWLLTSRSLNYQFTKLPQAITMAGCYVLAMCVFDVIMLQEPFVQDPQCWSQSSSSFNSSSDLAITARKITLNFHRQFNTSRLLGAFMAALILSIAFIGPVSSLLIVWYHGRIYDRELRNTWYSRNSLFFSKLISESISRLFCLGACGLAIYHISYESIEPWRVIIVMSAMYLASAFWENAVAAFTLLFGRNLDFIGVFVVLESLECFDFWLCDLLVFQKDATFFATIVKDLSVLNRAYRATVLALFGFGRCTSSCQSDLITLSMSENDGPRQVFSRVWYTLNATKDELIDALGIYEVEDSTVSSVFDFFSSWILPPESVIHQQPSYILSFYNYHDSQLFSHFLVLSAWFFASCLVLFFTMRRTSQLVS